MKKTLFFAMMSAALAVVPASAEADCTQVARSVKSAMESESATPVLEIVAREVSASPACACEIVKAAIKGTTAKPDAVAAIVEAACNAAPEQMRLIAQCAVATAPDALKEVQAVMAKLDPPTVKAEESAKSSKSAKASVEAPSGEVADMGNPLEFPGQGPITPLHPGGRGNAFGYNPLNSSFPSVFINPPIVHPPQVTSVNPNNENEGPQGPQ